MESLVSGGIMKKINQIVSILLSIPIILGINIPNPPDWLFALCPFLLGIQLWAFVNLIYAVLKEYREW